MEIKACPNCGSRRIFQGRMSEGVLTGYTNKDVCRNCGYQGMPIIFDSEKDYKNFLKSKNLKEERIEKKIEHKTKKVQKTTRPFGITILSIILIFEAFFAIFLYYLLLGVQVHTLIWIYYVSIFILQAILLPYGLINGKGWAWTIGGILFALSIPIGLIFLYYLTRPNVRKFYNK